MIMVLPAKDEEKEQACEDVPWEADSKHTGDEEAVPDWEQMMKLVCDSGRFTVLLEVDEDEEEAKYVTDDGLDTSMPLARTDSSESSATHKSHSKLDVETNSEAGAKGLVPAQQGGRSLEEGGGSFRLRKSHSLAPDVVGRSNSSGSVGRTPSSGNSGGNRGRRVGLIARSLSSPKSPALRKRESQPSSPVKASQQDNSVHAHAVMQFPTDHPLRRGYFGYNAGTSGKSTGGGLAPKNSGSAVSGGSQGQDAGVFWDPLFDAKLDKLRSTRLTNQVSQLEHKRGVRCHDSKIDTPDSGVGYSPVRSRNMNGGGGQGGETKSILVQAPPESTSTGQEEMGKRTGGGKEGAGGEQWSDGADVEAAMSVYDSCQLRLTVHRCVCVCVFAQARAR